MRNAVAQEDDAVAVLQVKRRDRRQWSRGLFFGVDCV